MNSSNGVMRGPVPILVMIVLSALSVARNFFPESLPPVGVMLAGIGAAFLILYLGGWVGQITTLVPAWVLLGFGTAYWASEFYPMWSVPLYLFGLSLAFFGVYVVGSAKDELTQHAQYWPALPGLFLLILGAILGLETAFGRERIWSTVLPRIPVLFTFWMIYYNRPGTMQHRPA